MRKILQILLFLCCFHRFYFLKHENIFLFNESNKLNTKYKEEYSCNVCCPPSKVLSNVAASYGLGFIGFTVIFLICIIVIYVKSCKEQFLKDYMKKLVPKIESFPKYSVYHGHYLKKGKWASMSDIKLNFKENLIKGKGFDEGGNYKIKGILFNDRRRSVHLVKSYILTLTDRIENNECSFELDLVARRTQHSLSPSYIGKYYNISNKKECGLWFITPKEINYNGIHDIFPLYTERSKIEIMLFVSLAGFSFAILFNYFSSLPKFSISFYTEEAINIPWGCLFSILGVFLLLFVDGVFKIRKNSFRRKYLRIGLCIFYYIVAILCLTFALLDLIVADFVKSETLIKIEGSEMTGFIGKCDLISYGCLIYWKEPYTMQTSSCLNRFDLKCIAFEDPQNLNCFDSKNNLFSYLFINSILSLILFFLWECMLVLNIYLNYIRWVEIAKIEGWDIFNYHSDPISSIENKKELVLICENNESKAKKKFITIPFEQERINSNLSTGLLFLENNKKKFLL